ncbi:MAG: SET domain-containing protein-lysine N-methyltransferase [Bryobacteraceae bacterium]
MPAKTTSKKQSQNGHTRAGAGAPQVNLDYCQFRLRIGPSKIHRWGVFAAEDIPAHRKIIEYTGELISRRETKRRAEASEHIYLFTVDPYWVKDGSVGGSGAEYINHCCSPNVRAVVIKRHILYMAKRKIRRGEELTIDYNFDKHVEKVPCICGAPDCRGTINVTD